METFDPKYWFEDTPVLAKLPPERAAAKLRELGDIKTAEAIENSIQKTTTRGLTTRSDTGWNWPRLGEPKPWQHTSHTFGYIPPFEPGSLHMVDIIHASNTKADNNLKNSRIKITLDRLRIADYPGGGIHRILFDFYAQNHVKDGVEHLHFNQTYRAQEGEQAGIIGYPVFIGLQVGTEGIAFKCYTVNVKNDDDEAILNFLDTDVFRSGLKLATTAQPAIAPLVGMAVGLTKMIAERHRNVPVQDFYMGLDFSNTPTGARLAQGSYIAVQIPERDQTAWNWQKWIYNPSNGHVVQRDSTGMLIPYNYIIIGVSKYEGT